MEETMKSNQHASYGSTKCARYPQPVISVEDTVDPRNYLSQEDDLSILLPLPGRNVHDVKRGAALSIHKSSILKYTSLSFCMISICLFLSSYKGYEIDSITSLFHLRSSNVNREAIFADMDIEYEDIRQKDEKSFSTDSKVEVGTKKIVLPTEQIALLRDHEEAPPPFSTLHPVNDLNVLAFERPSFSTPGRVFGQELHKGQGKTGYPLPTNKWYENMVLMADQQIAPTDDNRVYTVPYVMSANGPVPGIKLESTRLLGMERVVQVTFVDTHGITLGAAESFDDSDDNTFGSAVQRRYTVFDDDITNGKNNFSPLTPLGFTIKWEPQLKGSNFDAMSSSVVRGMPYGTMKYKYNSIDGKFNSIFPTVVSQIQLYSPPVADSKRTLKCSRGRNSTHSDEHFVEKSIQVTFLESDVTWLIFYSQPVYVRCYDMEQDTTTTPFVVQVTRVVNATLLEDSYGLVSRVALMNNCTIGANPSHCKDGKPNDKTEYGKLLHDRADFYPGPNTKIDYTFFSEDFENGGTYSYVQYDWDVHHTRYGRLTPQNGIEDAGLLMYSLPHHREAMHSQSISPNSFIFDSGTFCTPSLNGDSCIVEGAAWVLKENLDGEPSFFAPRPPLATAIENLSNAIQEDIKFRVPEYFARGAGDTYFSGKILAKLSRILLVTHELQNICSRAKSYGSDYVNACRKITLPTRSQFKEALDHLKSSTQVWIDGTAESPFVYDDKWGGICACGCYFNGKTQSCDNKYPNCPAFSDPGLDFGHAFYNDHHFHQGYHIYAAATVAYFDNSWGIEYFEKVLLLVRDIANPSSLDNYFPQFRMKDWYLGNSWAGGIAMAYPNGRNQESSSESIAAYEAISMYGEVMAEAFLKTNNIDSKAKGTVARHVRDVGRLLTATELRSADTYWHVRQQGAKSGIYPPQYKPLVVGIMWNMMAQFQTWFGSAPHLAYGIQLLPLTPVSERRDAHDWIEQLYPSFAESCSDAPDCREQGWGILQHAVLAELGHPHLAIDYVEALPKDAYLSAGGNGHSLTNSIWYYATRPETNPIKLSNVTTPAASPTNPLPFPQPNNITATYDCGCPNTCTGKVQSYPAGGFTCGARISWLMKHGKSERDACSQVAGVEYTDTCAGCDPNRCTTPLVSPVEANKMCPPCTREQCKDGQLNKCPVLDAPFLCTDGENRGGCSMVPWQLNTGGGSNCNKCCQLTYECQ